MHSPTLPPDEPARKRALDALCLLDTEPEERFDAITRLAQQRFEVPIALISLVDTERQWFKSKQGLDVCETPRDVSFCGHAILGSDTFVVEDATMDRRFCNNPLVVGDLNIRFYAGRPLVAPGGERVGTLCIIDFSPREFNSDDRGVLDMLAKLVEREFLIDALRRQADRARNHELRFRTLARHAPIGIFETDADGFCVFTNCAWEQITGLTESQARGTGWSKAIHPEDRDLVFNTWNQGARTNGRITLEFRVLRPDNEVRWVRSHANPIFAPKYSDSNPIIGQVPYAEDGQKTGWIGTTEDITEARRTQLALQESEERFRELAEHVEAVFWITDVATHQVLYVNPAFERIWGRTIESIYANPMDWIESIHPDDREATASAFAAAITDATAFEAEFRILRPDGSIRYILDRGFPVRNAAGEIYRLAGVAYDVTDQRMATLSLEELARTDSLTELANRRHFNERLDIEIARAQRESTALTVAIFDIDHFKHVNDNLGHAVGDQALILLSEALMTGLRATDIPGRLGGDELAVIFPNTCPSGATKVLSRILEKIRQPLGAALGAVIRLSCSVGAATWTVGQNRDALMRCADMALYLAKQRGRDQIAWYDEVLSVADPSLALAEANTPKISHG